MDPRLLSAIGPLVDALEELGIDYELGGSVASSVHGVPRSSLDIDILAALAAKHVPDLERRLAGTYYISATRVADAIEREASFNLIHLETMFKIDVFIARSDAFRLSSLQRRKIEALSDERSFFVTSAEDIVLHKLNWYRKGGEVSRQQWQDVLGVMKMQGARLDERYLRDWAEKLQVIDLLERALSEAEAG
jgi:hypothetical protein